MKDIVFLGFTLVMAFVLSKGAKNVAALYSKGKAAMAKIVKKEAVADSGYYVSYQFQPAAGAQQEARVPVAKKLYDTLRDGGTVEVRYLEQQPGCHMIAADMHRAVKLYPMIIAFYALCAAWYTHGA